jgi:hypothetical protein
MRLYLAGPSAELNRVKHAASVLEREHDLTWRWWVRVRALRDGRPTDAGLDAVVLQRVWRENVLGILEAQGVVALAQEAGGLSSGTREEIAYALARSLPVVVVGDPWYSLAATGCARVHSLEQALALLTT